MLISIVYEISKTEKVLYDFNVKNDFWMDTSTINCKLIHYMTFTAHAEAYQFKWDRSKPFFISSVAMCDRDKWYCCNTAIRDIRDVPIPDDLEDRVKEAIMNKVRLDMRVDR